MTCGSTPPGAVVTRAGRTVELTPREFALLHFLARNAGEVVPRAELLEHVWDDSDETSTNVVDVYVGYLRRKLERPFRRRAADPHGPRRGLRAGAQVRLPIRARLTAWYAALLAAIMVALGGFLTLQLKSDLEQDIEREVRAGSAQISLGYAKEGPADFRDVSRTVLPHGSSAAQVLSPDGRVLVAYGELLARRPIAPPGAFRDALNGKQRLVTVRLGPNGQRFRGSRLTRQAARPGPRAGRRRVVAARRGVRGPGARCCCCSPARRRSRQPPSGGWWLARKALLPVDRMTSQAEEIGIDRLHDRIALPPARDEIGRLAETLNAMLDRLERGVEEKRRMVADASHELRTPLAAMRAELDVSLMGDDLAPAGREVLESTREEVDRMSRIVDNLLTLARVDEGRLELLTTTVDLGEAADAAARPLRPLATREGRTADARRRSLARPRPTRSACTRR